MASLEAEYAALWVETRKLTGLLRGERGLAALVDAAILRLCDALALALQDQCPLELNSRSVAIADWLAAHRIGPTTLAAYTAALAPVMEEFGGRQCTTITKAQLEGLVQALREGTGPGRRR